MLRFIVVDADDEVAMRDAGVSSLPLCAGGIVEEVEVEEVDKSDLFFFWEVLGATRLTVETEVLMLP